MGVPIQGQFDRRTGVGASMAPVIMRLSPFATKLWAHLWYRGKVDDTEATEEMGLGNALEPAILSLIAKRMGVSLTKPPSQRHDTIDWLYASPDSVVDGDQTHGIEVKNVGMRYFKEWGEPGTDQVPVYVLVQCQHQMEVCNFTRVTVGALLCGGELRLYEVQRSEPLIRRILSTEADFWHDMKAGRPPDPDWEKPETPDLIAKLYKPSTGLRVELGAQAEMAVLHYQQLTANALAIKHEKETVKAKLIELMGCADEAALPDGTVIQRPLRERAGYTVDATSYYDFRVTKPKGMK